MKIREEIEKLRKYDNLCVDAVLPILDEHLGECVAEQHLRSERDAVYFRALRIADLLPEIVVEPGDRISIYVRRKR